MNVTIWPQFRRTLGKGLPRLAAVGAVVIGTAMHIPTAHAEGRMFAPPLADYCTFVKHATSSSSTMGSTFGTCITVEASAYDFWKGCNEAVDNTPNIPSEPPKTWREGLADAAADVGANAIACAAGGAYSYYNAYNERQTEETVSLQDVCEWKDSSSRLVMLSNKIPVCLTN